MSKDVAIQPRAVPFGSYHLLERLAVGGMAEVYLAKSFGVAGDERLVALKRILPSIAEDDEFIAMFIDEAKIAGQLNHPNIAQIHDLGKINASYFIAMEYVSGHDLRALWERTRDKPDGLPIGLACFITQKICEGLDYAHRRRDNRGRPLNIIHRDVSPQNVLLSYDGDVKVIDFGIAKAANRMVRTQTGILKGKFAYMAPEQARGEPTDHRADIFAIGVILYELLTGERAFKADSDFQLLEKVRKVEIKEPRKIKPSIPRELERIVYKAMERDAGDRYPFASVLAGELERFLQNHAVTSNRQETGAFIRTTFKDELEEERRRLEVYRGFKADVAKAKAKEREERRARGERSNDVSPEQATRVKVEPSREERKVDEEIHYLGTEVGDAVEDESGEEVAAEPTRLISDEEPASRRDKEPHRPASRVRALDDAPLPPPPVGDGPAAPTQVLTPGRPIADQTQVFSSEGESVGDATMIDDGPSVVADDERRPPLVEGTRPDVRASALGHVLGEGDDGAASSHHDENLFATKPRPPRRDRPTTAAAAAEAARVVSGPSPAVTVVTPPGAPSSTRPRDLGIGAAAGLGVGLVVALIVGLVGDDPDLVILAEPSGSRVKLREETLCERTPCAVEIGAGKHELVFVAEGYDPLSRTVEVTGDALAVVEVQLPRRASGLVLETVPPGAKVRLNGKALGGETPLKLPELVVGDKVELAITLKGYDTVEEIFEVPDTGSAPWRFELLSSMTAWTVKPDPPDAVVFAEDGKGKEGEAVLRVARGKSEAYRVARPGCDASTGSIQGTGQPEASIDVKLTCRPFDARITVNVRGRADFAVDGIELPGRRSLFKYDVPAGEHEITVRPRRGREEKLPVVIKKGEEFEYPGRGR